MTTRDSVPRKGIFAWVLAAACVLGWTRAAHSQDLQPGAVIPRVECRTEEGFSFALYLPSTYAPGRPWPVLFCFSPSGRGVDPVLLLQASAERYGYIVVGSNDSKNGPWGPVAKAQTALWKEVHERFPVDPARSYAVGFSGGARAAMLLALKHRGESAGDPPSILGVLRDLDRARKAGGEAARNADIVFRLAGFHFSELGATLLRMGRYREAAFCLETSVAAAPGNPLYAYNAACATARCGLKAKALGYLRRAVANGFKDGALMAKDPDLDSLRKEPAFTRIHTSVNRP